MSEDTDTLSDAEFAEAIAGVALLFDHGDRSREETVFALVDVLAREEWIEDRRKSVSAQGRITVGAGHTGEYGTTLFVPDHGEESAE